MLRGESFVKLDTGLIDPTHIMAGWDCLQGLGPALKDLLRHSPLSLVRLTMSPTISFLFLFIELCLARRNHQPCLKVSQHNSWPPSDGGPFQEREEEICQTKYRRQCEVVLEDKCWVIPNQK